MKPIIKIHGLGKRYRIGERRRYGNLRESIVNSLTTSVNALRSLGRNGHSRTAIDDAHIWALRDVNLDIMPGEVLGVIGRNGAGKSTLLKILSRITDPTTGRVELYGRVGSLLEVGTGFHPELTGRENIYLSAAILGMRRAEIVRKFDEIVSFAEVERFIDTSVKHYSSGMYVRLAFAVAAHLEPEIMIIDEVLAVGDADFQRKCLGKMDDVARHGRTVIFVSHNMAAVQRLCHNAALLENGQIAHLGASSDVVVRYLTSRAQGSLCWERDEPPVTPYYFTRISLVDERNECLQSVTTGGSCRINLEFTLRRDCRGFQVSLDLLDDKDEQIFGSGPQDAGICPPEVEGTYRACVVMPSDLLLGRRYAIRAALWHPQLGGFDRVVALRFKVEETASLANSVVMSRPGLLAIRCDWSLEPVSRGEDRSIASR